MKYSNAYKGIKKIFIVEILQIAASVIAAGGLFFLDDMVNSNSGNGAAAGLSLSFIGVSIITILALIIYLIGLSQAQKEEKKFHLALVVTIIALVTMVAASVFEYVNPVAGEWLEFACEILELVAFESVVSGVVNIAKAAGDERVLSIGRKMRVLVTAIWIVLIAAKLLDFFAGDISEYLKIVHFALEIIDHILYMILLIKGRRMIEDINKADDEIPAGV